MDFKDKLLTRESCRSYSDKPVSREDLLKICEAGRLSPSACNSQPWRFIIVDSPEAKKKLGDALVVGARQVSGCTWKDQVPAFIIIVENKAQLLPAAMDILKNSQHFSQIDIGLAAMNMCYAAQELGLSTCMVGMCDQDKMKRHFNIPADLTVRLTLAVGYSKTSEPPRQKIRKPLEEIVSYNAW